MKLLPLFELSVYHGSKKTDLVFSDPKTGSNKKSRMQLDFGTHFTDKEYASFYAGDKGKVYAATLDLKSPLDLTKGVWKKTDPDFERVYKLIHDLKLQKSYMTIDYNDYETGSKTDEIQSVSINAHKLDGIAPAKVVAALRANGFDSIIYTPYHPQGGGKYYEPKSKSYIVLDKDCIKVENETN